MSVYAYRRQDGSIKATYINDAYVDRDGYRECIVKKLTRRPNRDEQINQQTGEIEPREPTEKEVKEKKDKKALAALTPAQIDAAGPDKLKKILKTMLANMRSN